MCPSHSRAYVSIAWHCWAVGCLHREAGSLKQKMIRSAAAANATQLALDKLQHGVMRVKESLHLPWCTCVVALWLQLGLSLALAHAGLAA